MEREICAKSPATWNSYIIKPSTGGPGVPCRHRGSCQTNHPFFNGISRKKVIIHLRVPPWNPGNPPFFGLPKLGDSSFPLAGERSISPHLQLQQSACQTSHHQLVSAMSVERAILNPPYTLMLYTPIYRKIGDGGSYGFANIMFDGKFDAKTSAIQGFSAKQQHHDCNADVGSSSPWTNRLWTCEKPPVLNEGASKGGSPKVYGGFLK